MTTPIPVLEASTIDGTPCWVSFKISNQLVLMFFYERHSGNGIPFSITDVQMQGNWGPLDIAKKYPGKVWLTHCETQDTKRSSVQHFFRGFGSDNDRMDGWKIKVI